MIKKKSINYINFGDLKTLLPDNEASNSAWLVFLEEVEENCDDIGIWGDNCISLISSERLIKAVEMPKEIYEYIKEEIDIGDEHLLINME